MRIIQSRALLIYCCFPLLFYSEVKGQHRFHNQLSFASLLNVGPTSEARFGSINLLNSFAVDYSRRFNHIIVDVAYSQWNARIFNSSYNVAGVFLFAKDTSEWIGSPWFRYNYRFVDIIGSYQFMKRRVTIAGGAGPSLTWGTNTYVSGYYFSGSGIPDYVIWTDAKKDNRFGLLAQVNAEYTFLHERMSAGIIFKERWYPDYFHQFEFGIRAGLNF